MTSQEIIDMIKGLKNTVKHEASQPEESIFAMGLHEGQLVAFNTIIDSIIAVEKARKER